MKKNIEKEILRKIKAGEVRMKPRWKFEMERKFVVGVWIITLVIAAFFGTMMLKFIEEYQPFEILEYGEIGRQLLLEDTPYWWLVGGIGLMIAGVILDSKIGNNYKKSMTNLGMVVVGATMTLIILFRFLAF